MFNAKKHFCITINPLGERRGDVGSWKTLFTKVNVSSNEDKDNRINYC